jgi:hypothetical protein
MSPATHDITRYPGPQQRGSRRGTPLRRPLTDARAPT